MNAETERVPGGRRKYGWHKYDCLRNMEQGESIRLSIEAWEYAGYRTMASRFKQDFGVRFTMRYRNGILTITRIDKDMKVTTQVKGNTRDFDFEENDFREGFDFAIRHNPQFWAIVRDIAGKYQAELMFKEAKRRKLIKKAKA